MSVAFTNPNVHPASGPFYTMFPWEPVQPRVEIKVDRVVVTAGLTLERVLEQIPGIVGNGGTVFIIHHGTLMGLNMPLARGTRVKADVRVMDALDSSQPDAQVAQTCLFPHPQHSGAQRVHALREKMRRVKDLRLDRVELRACNTGQNVMNMQRIKRFFNCRTLGAPNLRDSFFFLNPGRATSDEQRWQNWQQAHPRHRLFDVPAGGRVGVAIEETSHTTFNTFMIVNQDSASSFWADVYLARLHTHSVGTRQFPGHALYKTSPHTTSPSFPLIFPGDDTYADHIIHV